MAPPTVLSLKVGFLAHQTRLLSQPLNPSRAWRNTNDEAEDGIPERLLDDALFRLNHTLQQHSRRVFAPQATRHVAEQIDQLYWDAGERVAEADREAGAEGLNVGLDLTDSETISSLPTTWESERDVNAHPMEAKRYSELVERIQALSAQRSRAEENLLHLRRISELVRPFQSDDDGRGVQDNLVTRGGEVEKEMERMRMLLARVGARLGHLRERSDPEPGSVFGNSDAVFVDDVETDERRKVNDLLDRF